MTDRKQRERGGSMRNLEEFLKRKRVRSDEEKKEEGGSPFHRSKNTQRSPTRVEGGEKGEGEEEGDKEDRKKEDGSIGGIEELKKLMENVAGSKEGK